MKHYIDITILPSEDIGVHFLWSKLMMQVHLALVEMQDSNKQVPIAVSFPNYRMNTDKCGFLGNKLRLFSVSKADLERLNIHKWLSRLTDYLSIEDIADVPTNVNSFESFNRRQKAGSPDKHIRRRMKRHNESFEDASQYFSDYKMTDEDKALPFIKMKSLGSDNDFNLSIIRKTVDQSTTPIVFNTYGLSKQGCLPIF